MTREQRSWDWRRALRTVPRRRRQALRTVPRRRRRALRRVSLLLTGALVLAAACGKYGPPERAPHQPPMNAPQPAAPGGGATP